MPWILARLPYRSALDVGCSTGGSLAPLAGRGAAVVGVDVSSLAVAEARRLGRDVRLAEASRLPFEVQAFDLVVSADVLEHLAPGDVPAAVAELKRVASRFLFLKIATQADRIGRWRRLPACRCTSRCGH